MSIDAVRDAIADEVSRSGRPGPEIERLHLLEGILRRLGRSTVSSGFVLRGGLLTRLWAAPTPRPTEDLDVLGTVPFDLDAVPQAFFDALRSEVADGVVINLAECRSRGIWLDSAFPGVRLFLRCGVGVADRDITVDVGFGDPLVPTAEQIEYPTMLGDCATVWAVRPSTAVAWKLHGLAEFGPKHWRPKDLYDLDLITRRFVLDPSELAEAVRPAFESRGFPVSDALRVLSPEWGWATPSSRARWKSFCRADHIRWELPDAVEILVRVAERLPLTGL